MSLYISKCLKRTWNETFISKTGFTTLKTFLVKDKMNAI